MLQRSQNSDDQYMSKSGPVNTVLFEIYTVHCTKYAVCWSPSFHTCLAPSRYQAGHFWLSKLKPDNLSPQFQTNIEFEALKLLGEILQVKF